MISEWLAAGSTAHLAADHRLHTIAELAAAYYEHVVARYRKHGRPTSQVSSNRAALRFLLRLYADLPIEDFGPLKLQVCRQSMIDANLARTSINRHVARLRRMFAWAAANEPIDQTLPHRLSCVEGLRRGAGGREMPKVQPVAWQTVEAIRPHVSPQIWAMIQLQWYTGCRPGEVRTMRTGDIEAGGDLWLYRPAEFKTDHHDENTERVIVLGPRAQAVPQPWLRADLQEYLFQPTEAEAARQAARRIRCTARRRKRRPRWRPGALYHRDTYCRAITRACTKAGVPSFTPHRLRHSFATRARKRFGLDATRAALGHLDANVTLDYAKLDQTKAARVARKIG